MPRAAVETRSEDILDAALGLLREKGLPGVTTNALAARARCSKDTLYALFADRDAILAALIRRQAASLNERMLAETAIDGMGDRARLVEAGALLYALLLSEASLAINRAAMADGSGALSRLLVEQGQAISAPRLARLLQKVLPAIAPQEAYRRFYGLLISDRQILALHRMIPSDPPPAECRQAAERAVSALLD